MFEVRDLWPAFAVQVGVLRQATVRPHYRLRLQVKLDGDLAHIVPALDDIGDHLAPQTLGDRQDDLPVPHGQTDIFGDVDGGEQSAFLVARGARTLRSLWCRRH